jgi:hypothetical protein
MVELLVVVGMVGAVLVDIIVAHVAHPPTREHEWKTLDELTDDALADIAEQREWAEEQLRRVWRRQ